MAMRTGLRARGLYAHARGLANSRPLAHGVPQDVGAGAGAGAEPYERVAEAYRGRSVLLTGATGFLGKIMIERLLTDCRDLKTIYVLVRQKKDLTLEQRLQAMFSLPVFAALRAADPGALDKVVPIGGDLLDEQLGVSDRDRRLLHENVNIVFHAAASVQFKDTFRDLMQHNYFGTRKVLQLAKGIQNLESFVYFSTAYCNVARKFLDEKPVPALASQEDVDYCLRTNDVARLKKISGAPIYTFSKNFTEVMVEQERGELPLIIVRPAAVTACLRQPLPGWMDTWIAIPSIFVEHSRGLVSAAVGHRDVVADVIPADYVANLAIVAAARGRGTKELLIYNSGTGTMNPLTWKEGFDLFRQYALQEGKWDLPPRKMVQSSSYLVVGLLTLVRDRLPALLADLWLRLKGEQPKYVKMQRRALFMRDNVDALMETSLFFKCTQTFLLARTLDERDGESFPFDPNTIDWKQYMPTLYRSIYKYMMKKQ